MKKIFILVAALFLAFTGYPQPCLPDGITFTTQAQIDNFHVTYPGCNQIGGNVLIQGGNSITNLSGLNGLISIGKNLVINENMALSGLTGLNTLTHIGEGLIITGNNSLNSLNGLDNLVSIGGSLSISGDLSLTNIMALSKMTTIGGYLIIEYNNLLSNLTGLYNVNTIGGTLEIIDNDMLTSLTGLGNLTSIGGSILVWQNLSLVSLDGLKGLNTIGGEFSIENNYALSGILGLANLTSIGGSLSVTDNKVLANLAGLGNIDEGSISKLYIYNNNNLSECDVESVCNYLSSSDGYTEIHDNATGCNSRSEVEVACQSVDIPDNTYDNLFSIFPNPSTGNITIRSHGAGLISIMNLSGQTLVYRQINGPETQIDITGIPRGVYIVQFTNQKVVVIHKLFKI